MNDKILVVDDEEDIRNLVCGILDDEGYETCVAANSDQAYAQIKEELPALVIQDIWLQGSADDGLEILEKVKEEHSWLPFIMISGHGTIETAVQAIQHGAYDFIEKPFKSDRLLLMIKRALESAALRKENAYLRQNSSGRGAQSHELVGNSSTTEQLKSVLTRVAASNSRALISGEPGVGKDVAAWFIHENSERKGQIFKVVNCANLDPARLEEELFGVEGGDAGVLEGANGGTLFLDQVVDMPLETQGKILRVIQEQSFQRVGGSKERTVDIRILASSNKDLQAAIAEGTFREDLYYRLNVVPVEIAPLRKRTSDIPALVDHFVRSFHGVKASEVCGFSQTALAVMEGYSWPGNIRQLRNVVEWVLIMHGGLDMTAFEVEHLPPEIRGDTLLAHSSDGNRVSSGVAAMDASYVSMPLRAAREVFEKDYLTAQLERFDGNISQTAKFVGMERSALHRKLKSLGISLAPKDEGADNTTSKPSERRSA